MRGRWHVYPEMAAAGLWTTPTDLAKFAIEVQETLAGRGHGVISPAMARQFVTEQKGGSGLGVGVQGTGRGLRFSHGGRDEGFDALLDSRRRDRRRRGDHDQRERQLSAHGARSRLRPAVVGLLERVVAAGGRRAKCHRRGAYRPQSARKVRRLLRGVGE